ncbi:hypothetical protein IV203_000073 [Nitzschia inconspicua]|uniref:Uncharacterized protein n=1 Tax=Nitzschia inconspicua TaxID=303405 RepID=A0A9K3L4R3_9STRA|nr:hypothetical protein IV203_000073 [Nitzschia inconspicua]
MIIFWESQTAAKIDAISAIFVKYIRFPITSRLMGTMNVHSTSSGIDLLHRDEMTTVFDGSTPAVVKKGMGIIPEFLESPISSSSSSSNSDNEAELFQLV